MNRLQLPAPPTKDHLVLIQTAANRALAEQFIRQRFLEEHGARPSYFTRQLVALTGAKQQIQACLGYQGANQGPLFLEHYLDTPIERRLEALAGQPVRRAAIVEVGNLASVYPGGTRRIILSLGRYLYLNGYRWLVMTASRQVRNAFGTLGVGLELIPLADARAECLGDQGGDWGDYYLNAPQVVAARLDTGLERLRSNPVLAQLMQRAPVPVSDQGIAIAGEVA